ncbi:MAG TPA: DHA2 family efflux MFS transporter permease subunit [Candidatus Dormibacteraeota bacterium]|nr:DHA2 family efflux MFS transporter permease subunit [Candidatus Dormibacteraeota bacterium]
MSARRRWAMVMTICLGAFMIMLDTTIVYVATPSLMRQLSAPLDQVLWVFNGYLLAYAALLITTGRLADLWGPRNLFIAGLALFTAASALCGFAQTPAELIGARVIQGVGGAMLAPQSLTLLTALFPAERRGAALGIWGAVIGVSTMAGPTLGGFLITYADWRWIFFVNVPVGVIAIACSLLLIPDVRPGRRHRLDLVGVALGSAALFLVVFGLIEGQPNAWSNEIRAVIGGGVALLIAFLVWEIRQQEPLVPLGLFRDRDFAAMNGVGAAVNASQQIIFVPFAIYTQSVLGMSALFSGLTAAPLSVASGLVAPFAGRLADRIGGKYLVMLGLTLFAAGVGWFLAAAHVNSGGTDFILPLGLAGVGVGLIFAPMTTVAMRRIEPHQAAAASGVLNTTRQLGGALGSAMVGAVFQSQLAGALSTRASSHAGRLPVSLRAPFIHAFSHLAEKGLSLGSGGAALSIPAGLPAPLHRLLASLATQVYQLAFIDAMRPTLLLAVGLLLAAALVCLFVRGRSESARVELEKAA